MLLILRGNFYNIRLSKILKKILYSEKCLLESAYQEFKDYLFQNKMLYLKISYLIIFPDLVDEYQQYQDATADDDEDDEEEEYEQDGDY